MYRPIFTHNTTSGRQLANQEAQSAFDAYCSDLLDLADDIKRSNIIKDVINIPHVIAAGDQSSGKSSVLGILSGVQLPTGKFSLNTLFQLLREVDEKGSRTIIVFTKIDKISDDREGVTELIEKIHKKERHSFRNYVFVNSLKINFEDESQFFNNIIARFSLSAECCGFDKLHQKVCSLLIAPMYKEFNDNWTQVEKHFDIIKAQCRLLEDRINNRDRIVNRNLSLFIEQSRNALKCIYTSENGQQRDAQRIYAFYREYFSEFYREYKQKMETCPQSLRELADTGRQQEMRGFSNWAAFKSVAVPIVTSFVEPATKCQQKVLNRNKEVVYSFIHEYFGNHPQHEEFLRTKVDEIFEKQDSILKKQLERVYECEKYLHVDDELQGKFAVNLSPSGPAPAETNLITENTFFGNVLDSIRYTIRTFSAPILATFRFYIYLLFIDLAANRLANVIPSHILLCLNEEAQREIQTIDRYHEELVQLQWETPEEELRLHDYQERLRMFDDWKIRRQNMLDKHRRCAQVIAAYDA
ncbi:uncharacterized protein LOC142342348 [Convolutriloba macropyga]|uniref:uncharacterized protein LOC142342348 n=1 Tax=Convolutriloba macropyga TaxID=536237 RepID=UPI003F522884